MGDVAGDVFLGVVRAHLLLVDVFLEDVAQHVGVDLAVVAQRALVQTPVIGVEEVEEPDERQVVDLDVVIRRFDRMDVEDAAVEVRDLADQRNEFGVAAGLRLP